MFVTQTNTVLFNLRVKIFLKKEKNCKKKYFKYITPQGFELLFLIQKTTTKIGSYLKDCKRKVIKYKLQHKVF